MVGYIAETVNSGYGGTIDQTELVSFRTPPPLHYKIFLFVPSFLTFFVFYKAKISVCSLIGTLAMTLTHLYI